jgi:TPP-dependent trihydroxycyclohexane-1,2-dione (THcHDO) dehydratase
MENALKWNQGQYCELCRRSGDHTWFRYGLLRHWEHGYAPQQATANHPTLKSVYCQHVQACVAAAEGYAKAADFRKAAFAIVTAGPGASNAVTSLISAHGDSTPIVVLAGQIKTNDIDSFGTRFAGTPAAIRP